MTKLFNTTVFTKGSEYWLKYWTGKEPDAGYFKVYADYLDALSIWEKSFKEVRIHPTQVESFKDLAFRKWTELLGRQKAQFLKEGIELPPEKIVIKNISEKGYDENGVLQFEDFAFTTIPTKEDIQRELNYQKMLSISVEKEGKPIQLGDPMYNGKCKTCKCLTCICDPSPSEHNKEAFYKYGASLGIKINDLQRLAMLLKPSEHIQTQEERSQKQYDNLKSMIDLIRRDLEEGSLAYNATYKIEAFIDKQF